MYHESRSSRNGAKQQDQPQEPGPPRRQRKAPRNPQGALTGFAVRNRRATRAIGPKSASRCQPRRQVRGGPPGRNAPPRVGLHAVVHGVGRALYWAAADSRERSNGHAVPVADGGVAQLADLAGGSSWRGVSRCALVFSERVNDGLARAVRAGRRRTSARRGPPSRPPGIRRGRRTGGGRQRYDRPLM